MLWKSARSLMAASQTLGILGSARTGKSILLEVLAGAREFDRGDVFVSGLSLNEQRFRIQELVGLAQQDPEFDFRMTCYDHLFVMARIFGISKPHAYERLAYLLQWGQLDSCAQLRFNQLSPGQKKRASLVQALLHKPRVLMVDEPFVGIPEEDGLMVQLLEELKTKQQTLVIASVDFNGLESLMDQVLFLDRGRLVVSGTPQSLKARFAGKMVIEVPCAAEEVSYYLQRLQGQYPFLIQHEKLRLFLRNPEANRDVMNVFGENIVTMRPPTLEDVLSVARNEEWIEAQHG